MLRRATRLCVDYVRAHGHTSGSHRPDYGGGLHPHALESAAAEASRGALSCTAHAPAAVSWLIESIRLPLHRRERLRAAGNTERGAAYIQTSDDTALRGSAVPGVGVAPLNDAQEAARKRIAGMAMSELWALSFDVASGEFGWRPRAGTEELHELVPEFLETPIAPVQYDFVDLGCGSGALTIAAERYLGRDARWATVAVDPDAAARAAFPGASDGTADELDLPSSCAHAVIAADAFHWFATAPALFEISRVLQKRGYLGMLWTRLDTTPPCGGAGGGAAWAQEMDALLAPLYAEHPELDVRTPASWMKVFESFLGCYYGLVHHGVARASSTAMRAEELSAFLLAPWAGCDALPEVKGRVDALAKRLVAGTDTVEVPLITQPAWCQLLDK